MVRSKAWFRDLSFRAVSGSRKHRPSSRARRRTAGLRAEHLEDRRLLAGWAVSAGGSGDDYGEAIATFIDGSAVVAGSFTGSARFADTTLTSAGTRDVLVAKLNVDGSYAWAARAGQAGGFARATAISTLPDGSAIVAGTFDGSIAFGTTTLQSAGSDIFIAKISGTGAFAWAVRAGGSGFDHVEGLATDLTGAVILTGTFSDQASFGDTSLASAGSSIYVAKVGADGAFAWAFQPQGQIFGSGNGVATLPDGSALVTGSFSGNGLFGGIPLTSLGQDAFVLRVTANGVVDWALRAGGSGTDGGNGIAVLANGSAIMTGSFAGTAGFGGTTLVSAGSNDGFVATVNPFGQFTGASGFGGLGYDYGRRIATSADGSVAMTGYVEGAVTIGGTTLDAGGFVAGLDVGSSAFSWLVRLAAEGVAMGPGEAVLVTGAFSGTTSIDGRSLTSAGGSDAYLAAVNPAGFYEWAIRPEGRASAQDVARFADGSTMVTGTLSGVVRFGATTLIGSPDGSAYVAKLNPDGSHAWAALAGVGDRTYGDQIAVLGNGSSFVAGRFSGDVAFGDTLLRSRAGSDDLFVTKLGPSGVPLWAVAIKGRTDVSSGVGPVQGITALADGSLLVTGQFFGGLTFGGTTLWSVGNYDVFVAKLNADGSFAWAVRGGGTGEDEAGGIASLADGSVIVTGTFRGTAAFGGSSLTSRGVSDVFITKLDPGGSVAWAVQAGGESGSSTGTAVAAFPDGSSIVTGNFFGSRTFGGTTLVSAGYLDVFVARLRPDGGVAWAVQAGGAGYDGGEAIAALADGSIIVAGSFWGTSVFGSTVLRTSAPGGIEAGDVFVARLNSDGSPAWAARAGGADWDNVTGIAAGGDGSVVLVGFNTNAATFGGILLPVASGSTTFVAKLEGSGFTPAGITVGPVELGLIPAGYALRVAGRVIPVTTGGVNAAADPADGWIALAARRSGSGYELFWKNTRTAAFRVWTLDGLGALTGSRSLTLTEIREVESRERVDLDGDRIMGNPPVVFKPSRVKMRGVEFGSNASGYALRVKGRVIRITLRGRQASASRPGNGWTGLGARPSGSGYELFWRNTRTGKYLAWNLNKSGAFTRSRSLTLTELRGVEVRERVDINGDRIIGVPPSPSQSWANGKWDAFPSGGQYSGTPGVVYSGSTDIGNAIGSGRRYVIQGSTVKVYRARFPIEGGGDSGTPVAGLVQIGSGSARVTSVSGRPAVRLSMTDQNEDGATIRVTITLVRTDWTARSGWRFSELKGQATASDGFRYRITLVRNVSRGANFYFDNSGDLVRT